ncbi:MAG: hypothetical protein WEA76_02120 [Acidimicrobiia bacterium]
MKRLVIVLAALGLAACGRVAAQPVAVDRVVLDEFSIMTEAEVWHTGSVSLEIANIGERTHTLVISGADGRVVASTDIVEPNEVVEFNVDLGPGSYQLTCRIVVEGANGQLFDHFEQGMSTTVTVAKSPATQG